MSELFVSETYNPYPGLKLPDGTWISPDINVETFVLKRAPNSTANFNRSILDIECHPLRLITYGEKKGGPFRFKGIGGPFLGEGRNKRMKVYYFDKADISEYYQRLLSKKMDWEVVFKNEFGSIFIYGRHTRRGHAESMSAMTFLNDNVQVIRLRMYWVLRGIVGLRRLLSRVRMKHKRRKIFIQATYWGHPKCTLSCFSGTINTPVKQRIHAFI